VAVALGLTANNASVALHRARAELRTKLMDFCGDCACLDNASASELAAAPGKTGRSL
jgi:hypothetical protein